MPPDAQSWHVAGATSPAASPISRSVALARALAHRHRSLRLPRLFGESRKRCPSRSVAFGRGLHAARRQGLGWGHQVAGSGWCARCRQGRGGRRWRRRGRRQWRRGRSGRRGRNQVSRGRRDCAFAAGTSGATRDEHAALRSVRWRASTARWRRNEVARGCGLVHASCHVVDGRHADRGDQELSGLHRLTHAGSKAHSRLLGSCSNVVADLGIGLGDSTPMHPARCATFQFEARERDSPRLDDVDSAAHRLM